MITFTREQLIASAHARIEFAEMMLTGELEPLKERTWSIELELARIALASLEAEPVAWLWTHPERENDVSLTTPHNDEDAEDAMACGWSIQPLYTAMLQGAEQTNYRAIVERIAEIIHGKVTDIDLLTVTVKSMKDKLQK